MNQNIVKLSKIPEKLREIPKPPKYLYIEGVLPKEEDYKYLAIVGSRKYSSYGKSVCEKIISEIKNYKIVIVSGLAIGIDTIAHEEALRNKLLTIAVPGSGLSSNVLYPKTNFSLSRKIIQNGGCLLSEFEPDFKATTWSFPQRNRIMAGLCDAVLVIEAQEKSGTLITARLAMDFNRDVLVVPGQIFSKNSEGTNKLIKDGAHPITSAKDVLDILGIKEENNTKTESYEDCSEEEIKILNILDEPMSKDKLVEIYDGDISTLNITLSLLEIKGYIKETMGEIHKT